MPGSACKRITCCVARFVSLAQQWSRERRTAICYRQPFDCLKFSDDWKMWSFRSLRGSFQCGPAWDPKKRCQHLENNSNTTSQQKHPPKTLSKHLVVRTFAASHVCAQNGLSWMNELMCGGEPSWHLRKGDISWWIFWLHIGLNAEGGWVGLDQMWLGGTQIDRWLSVFFWESRGRVWNLQQFFSLPKKRTLHNYRCLKMLKKLRTLQHWNWTLKKSLGPPKKPTNKLWTQKISPTIFSSTIRWEQFIGSPRCLGKSKGRLWWGAKVGRFSPFS